jgi:hypothetical protein
MLRRISNALFVSRAWIVSIAFLFAVGSVVGTSQTFQTCIQEHYQHGATQNFEKSIPASTGKVGIYRDCLGEFTHDNAEAIIAAFTIILAFSTIFLWVATRDLVSGAEKTAEWQLRAYVFIQDVNIFLRENDTIIDVTVKFLNSGQTPGYDLRTSLKAEIRAAPTIGSPYTELAPPESKSIIAPKAGIDIGPNRLVLQDGDLTGLRDGTRKLYIWGRVDYVDAFKRDRYFSFQGTNGTEIANYDVATGRINWRGWTMRPSSDGYKAN